MSISYRPLFILLATKGLKKTDLYALANLTPNTVARFSKNEPVNMEIIERICKALGCQPRDIVEYIPDNAEK
ncbi:MAG: helix-turn-helix transcriptional regulator [Treponema sp.]|nr:helix-turn-helix transcriptional regulator [Treponema sp.]